MQLITKQKNNNNQNGFSLVELAIVILIVGIIIASFALMNKVYVGSYRHYAAQENLENAGTALNYFRNELGRFPCPADPTLNQDDVGYGEEDCSLTPITGERDADGIGGNDPVLIGNFPLYGFTDETGTLVERRRDLRALLGTEPENIKVEGRNVKDPWNEEFTYAVSQLLTNTSTFSESLGAIRITDEWGRNTGGTTANAQYVVLSQGAEDRSGCSVSPASSRVSQAEQENCDGDAHFTIALHHKTNVNHYDDYLTYKRSGIDGIWAVVVEPPPPPPPTPPPPTPPPDVFNQDLNGKVFIGPAASYNTDKPNNLKLDVAGDIFVEKRVASDLLCDSDGTTCFRPESLFSLSCPNLGEYMRGVEINGSNNLRPICEQIDFIPANKTCPTGAFLNGIYTDGEIACEN